MNAIPSQYRCIGSKASDEILGFNLLSRETIESLSCLVVGKILVSTVYDRFLPIKRLNS